MFFFDEKDEQENRIPFQGFEPLNVHVFSKALVMILMYVQPKCCFSLTTSNFVQFNQLSFFLVFGPTPANLI
jgi:hypothetical protein